MAIGVVHFGLSPSEVNNLTMREWSAIITEHKKKHRKK